MNEQSMELDEVLGYIRSIEDFTLGPMDAIRAQTEAIGDPSLPTPPQVATLEWLQAAYVLWAEDFPIEEPLASELRKLLPVAAALAITDAGFLLPGAHPIHKLLDSLHTSAIGWQASLGRAGLALEQLVAKAVAETSAWLREEGGDLATICEEIIAAVSKEQDRAQRMAQRLADTEKGRLRTASARWKGAEMINRALENHKATADIGEFLRGPWYESAQLVLLKFGADSNEWAQMSATTMTLLDSLQINDSAGEDERQQLFKAVTKIPKEVKRWLLSLHMDTNAVDEAIGVIEFTHLRLLRQQSIELEAVESLHMEGMSADRTTGVELETIESLEPGQWFVVDEGKGESLRVQLVLKLGQEQQLQFANKAGVKAMQQSYENFCALLAAGKATPLRTGASFSRCLANAAGIETIEDAEALGGETAPEQAQREASEAESERQESERILREQQEAERIQREHEEAERVQREQEEAERVQHEQQNAERILREQQDIERVQREQEEAERVQHEQREAERILRKQQEIDRIQGEQEEAERVQHEQREAERILREQQEIDRIQREQEEAERVQHKQQEAEPVQSEPDDAERTRLEQEEADRIRIEKYLQFKRERTLHPEKAREQSPAPAELPPAELPQEEILESSDPTDPTGDTAELHLQMGAWLGFHDGDTPLMAKLAVHDREQDSYIFVNREGIKMRSLNKKELVNLIDNNLVDILEPRSNFRDDVTRAKKDQG